VIGGSSCWLASFTGLRKPFNEKARRSNQEEGREPGTLSAVRIEERTHSLLKNGFGYVVPRRTGVEIIRRHSSQRF